MPLRKDRKKEGFDKFDNFLSSILINCCQLPCLTPSQEQYCTYCHTHIPGGGFEEDRGTGSDSNNKIITVSTADWMQAVARHNDTIVLKDLIIPGTHDSGSYSIRFQPFAAAARTQNFTIGQQLMAGVRYLDVRIATCSKKYEKDSPSKLSIWHGFLEGGSMESVLGEIKDFCNSHVECVILELVPEFGRDFSVEQKRKCLQTVIEAFGKDDLFVHAANLTNVIQKIPLAELLNIKTKPTPTPKNNNKPKGGKKKGTAAVAEEKDQDEDDDDDDDDKQPEGKVTVPKPKSKIIVLLHDRFFENNFSKNEMNNQYYTVSNTILCNPWHNTHDVSTLLQKNYDARTKRFASFHGLMCNQFVITPGVSGTNDVIQLIKGTNSLRPVSWACRLYQNTVLDNYFRQYAARDNNVKWNICTFDYIDLCPDIIDFLISLNFASAAKKMKIGMAVVESLNTNKNYRQVVANDTINKFLYRDCVLYIIDPIEELGLLEEYKKSGENTTFTLTIGYSIVPSDAQQKDNKSNSYHHVVTIPFHGECTAPILLCPFFCTNDGSNVIILNDNDLATDGIIVKGNKKYNPKDVASRAHNNEDDDTCPGTKLHCKPTKDGYCQFQVLGKGDVVIYSDS